MVNRFFVVLFLFVGFLSLFLVIYRGVFYGFYIFEGVLPGVVHTHTHTHTHVEKRPGKQKDKGIG